jgi:hypothetical protein
MRKVNANIINARSDQSITSDKIDTNQVVSISFLANFTNGDEAGTIKIQASNDPCPDQYQPATFTPTNWCDVPNATATITSGSSALITIAQCTYRWLRVVYTLSGGGAAGKVINVNYMGLSV